MSKLLTPPHKLLQQTALVLLLALIIMPNNILATARKEISVAIPEFPGYSNHDGTGVYFDLLREVFEPEGYEIKTKIFPYSRALYLLGKNDLDIVFALYHEEVDTAYFPQKKYHFDSDIICILRLKRRVDLDDEKRYSYNFAWQRTYGYQDYIDEKIKYTETSSLDSSMRMLSRSRVDYVIEPEEELLNYLNDNALNPKVYHLEKLMELFLYPGFIKNKFGKKLQEIYEKRLSELKSDNSLKSLFTKYNHSYYEDMPKSICDQSAFTEKQLYQKSSLN